ncbi:coiled-coil domain-containing protein 12 isoform X1 [Rhineura floridana]|uniref:coiled-coil domain-containing protein 12 isoform X1 n=1 Tax=Rhineura floridana TaxID=261503 RepID=UPI002AC80F4F|nr:coiled-coil domain-containing protein 12 isoform X1 [Rhineura floridana]
MCTKMAAAAGGLQEAALRRKERLKALRERTGAAARQNKDDGAPEIKQLRSDSEEGETPKHTELKLRNYTPEDDELKGRVVPQAKPASVEEKVKDQLEAAKPEPIIEEVGLETGRSQEAGEAGEADAKGHCGADTREAERPGGGLGVGGWLCKAGRKRFGLKWPVKQTWETDPLGAALQGRPCPRWALSGMLGHRTRGPNIFDTNPQTVWYLCLFQAGF